MCVDIGMDYQTVGCDILENDLVIQDHEEYYIIIERKIQKIRNFS